MLRQTIPVNTSSGRRFRFGEGEFAEHLLNNRLRMRATSANEKVVLPRDEIGLCEQVRVNWKTSPQAVNGKSNKQAISHGAGILVAEQRAFQEGSLALVLLSKLCSRVDVAYPRLNCDSHSERPKVLLENEASETD
jgi:hypothetical protein